MHHVIKHHVVDHFDHMTNRITLYFSEEGGDIDEAYSDINDSKSGMK